jgi:hypothetical protein
MAVRMPPMKVGIALTVEGPEDGADPGCEGVALGD